MTLVIPRKNNITVQLISHPLMLGDINNDNRNNRQEATICPITLTTTVGMALAAFQSRKMISLHHPSHCSNVL